MHFSTRQARKAWQSPHSRDGEVTVAAM
jgi:hypothetical protein